MFVSVRSSSALKGEGSSNRRTQRRDYQRVRISYTVSGENSQIVAYKIKNRTHTFLL